MSTLAHTQTPDLQPVTPATGDDGRPRRVLLVEDDADQRGLITWMLRAQGFEVLEATSGVELLAWIGKATSAPKSRYFDVIVSDVNMPDLTALDVLTGWRYGGWPAPLILVTASADPAVRSEADASGALTVLKKPLQQDELSQAIARALRAIRRPAAGSASLPADPAAPLAGR